MANPDLSQSVSSQGDDYRAGMFSPPDEGPYWLCVEDENGQERTAGDALALVVSIVGPADEECGPAAVDRVRGRVEDLGPDGWYFHKGDGPLTFWEVETHA